MLKVATLLAAAAGADAKAALRATTEEAVERGAFGSPSMVIDMTGNAEVNPAGDDGDGELSETLIHSCQDTGTAVR